jgi:hypothetical protein
VSPANLALRFLLELTLLAALGYWGTQQAVSVAARGALAVAAPLAAALAWGAVVSPKARVRAPTPVRLLVELALFASGAWALAAADRTRWAAMFAAAVTLHELWRVSSSSPIADERVGSAFARNRPARNSKRPSP